MTFASEFLVLERQKEIVKNSTKNNPKKGKLKKWNRMWLLRKKYQPNLNV
jgi:hypothetical protein